MRRALFSREFRTALVSNLITIGAMLGTLVAVERLYGLRLGKAEDVRVFIDFLLVAGLVVSGFISGERCFPSELKEQRMFFLASLPISRSEAWQCIVSARLLAALTSLALAVVLRHPLPSLLENQALLRTGIVIVALLGLLFYVLFFSAGTLFALLFRRTLFTYIAGGLFLGILLTETLLASSYPQVSPQLSQLEIVPDVFVTQWGPHWFLAVFLSLLSLWSFQLSWRFFIRGEIGNTKRRIGNQFLFGITATVYLGIVFSVASSAMLVSFRNVWRDTFDGLRMKPLSYHVSPDGRHLLVFEASNYSPFMIRVTVVDTETGSLSGRSVYGGVGWGYWSENGDVLNLLSLKNSPLDRWGYLIPGAMEWTRLSPTAQELSKLRLPGIEAVEILAGGRALIVVRKGSQGRILLLDGASGRSSEVAQAPLDGKVVIRTTGPAALVYFDNVILPGKAWIVDPLVHEVRLRSPLLLSEGAAYVLFGEILGSRAKAQAELRRRFTPPLSKAQTPVAGSFLIPSKDRLWILTSGQPVYFLDESVPDAKALWARSTASEGRWERLPDLAPELLFRINLSSGDSVFYLGNFIDSVSGAGAFLTKNGGVSRMFIYDSPPGVMFAKKECGPEEQASFDVNRTTGLKGILIGLNCSGREAPFRERTFFFEHLPGSREVRMIQTAPAQPYIDLSPLFLNDKGRKVWLAYDGTIWMSSPGKKDLRLWPVQAKN